MSVRPATESPSFGEHSPAAVECCRRRRDPSRRCRIVLAACSGSCYESLGHRRGRDSTVPLTLPMLILGLLQSSLAALSPGYVSVDRAAPSPIFQPPRSCRSPRCNAAAGGERDRAAAPRANGPDLVAHRRRAPPRDSSRCGDGGGPAKFATVVASPEFVERGRAVVKDLLADDGLDSPQEVARCCSERPPSLGAWPWASSVDGRAYYPR